MQNLKFKSSDLPGCFVSTTEDLTESDILDMALYLSKKRLSVRQQVDSPDKIVNYLRCLYHGHQREIFGVIFLDAMLSIIETREMFSGSVNQVLIIPREIIREALLHNAHSIIVYHNHLTANANPSSEDRKTTMHLATACKTVGLNLVDHLIVTPAGHTSFADLGLL